MGFHFADLSSQNEYVGVYKGHLHDCQIREKKKHYLSSSSFEKDSIHMSKSYDYFEMFPDNYILTI